MLKNYIKTTFRNIIRHKGFSFINITGLAIGMACSIIILIWVSDELSYDRFHDNADNLYRVEQDYYYSGEAYHVNVTPFPAAPAFKEEVPEVVETCRIETPGGLLFRKDKISFFESRVYAVDSSFLNMFTFPLVEGDKNTALSEPFSIVLSREAAKKYFGDKSPVGEFLNINNQHELIVTGVFENIPENSILSFDMLVNFDFLRVLDEYYDSWTSNSIFSFLQLQEGSTIEEVNKKITAIIREKIPESSNDLIVAPFTKIHLYSYFGFGHDKGNIQFVYIFSTVAIFVLIVACVNFMNLSTARSAGRSKEIGIRKVSGANRRKLIIQFYGESVLLSFLAVVTGVILVILIMPFFNNIASKNFTLQIFSNWQVIAGIFIVTLITGIIAGSYPALLMSSFKPVKILKGNIKSGKGALLFRKILVVFQFCISILLIIGTAVIYKQTSYLKNKNIGFDKEAVVCIPMRGEIKDYYSALKDKLLTNTEVLGVTASAHSPSAINSNSSGVEWDGKDPDFHVPISINTVDYDFVETMKIEMKSGRSFSREFSTDWLNDSIGSFLINEETEKIMGVESAVGMDFSFMGREGQIIGVMKNFHYQPATEEIEPLAMILNDSWRNYILIRVQPGNIPSSLDNIKDTWETVIPDYPFDYFFLDEEYESMYQTENRIGSLLKIFALLAIFIACLGLFGLASFTTEQRTKEIGIRKILGASVSGVTMLLSKEFTKWVLISFIISTPLAWFIMNNWLQDYAYRIKIGWMIFAVTGIISVMTALLTISFQSIRAARKNPSDTLRYE